MTAYFEVTESRYSYAMYFISIPPWALSMGGDVTGLLWRPVDEPENWTFTLRTRFYLEKSAWGGKDRRQGYSLPISGSEEFASSQAAELLRDFVNSALRKFGPMEVETLIIRGGPDAFHAAVQRENPNWLQCQVMTEE